MTSRLIVAALTTTITCTAGGVLRRIRVVTLMFEVFRLSLSPSAYLKSGRGGNRLRRETQKSLSSCSWGSRGVWQLTNIKWSHYWFSLGLQQTIILVIEYSIDYSIDYRSNQINTFTIKNIYKRKSNIMNELL